MATGVILGCGEWGFRNRPMVEWFYLATELGFRHLEFGIGGGWPGRLPEEPTATDMAVENDFTRPDAAEHAAQVRKVLAQLRPAADCGAQFVRLFAGFTPAGGDAQPGVSYGA